MKRLDDQRKGERVFDAFQLCRIFNLPEPRRPHLDRLRKRQRLLLVQHRQLQLGN